MRKIAWVTDSTAFLDSDLLYHPDVYSIPISIFINNNEYLDGITITNIEFYEKLKTTSTIPKTSQPSIGKFVELYQKLSKKYDLIISIHISSDLSGTVSTASQAAKLVDVPVEVIDSRLISSPISVLIKKGILVSLVDPSLSSIKASILELTKCNETYVLVGNLNQLHRSGRMNSTQYVIGSMLQIKPIIELKDGRLKIVEKVRSEKKATIKIIEFFKKAYTTSSIKEVHLLYGLRDEKAQQWKAMVEEFADDVVIKLFPLGVAIGVHAGEETVGISWFNEGGKT